MASNNPQARAAIAYMLARRLREGGIVGLRRLADELIAEERINTFLAMATVLEEHSDLDPHALYETALAVGVPELRLQTLLEIAEVEAEDGDVNAAGDHLMDVVESDDEDATPRALVMLGDLLSEIEPMRAWAAYEKAIASGHPEAAPRAALHKAALLIELDVTDGVRDELEFATTAANPEVRTRAMLMLGTLERRERPTEAAVLLRGATESPLPEIAGRAAVLLARLEYDEGEREAGIARLMGIATDDDQPMAGLADATIGVLLRDTNPRTAEHALRRAWQLADEEVAPEAGRYLGAMLLADGRDVEGSAILNRVLAIDGRGKFAQESAVYLALHAVYRGTVDTSAPYWLLAADLMNHDVATSFLNAGLEAEERGDTPTALAAFELAARSDDQKVAQAAAAHAARLGKQAD